MKRPKNPKSAPQKEDPTTKKNDELGQDELNKVTGADAGAQYKSVFIAMRKSGGDPRQT
jgi:hypothetical protein